MKDVNNDMELAVLGSMIRDRSIIPNVQAAISEADFFEPINREIFRAILKLNFEQKPVNQVSLFSEVNKNPALIAQLTDVVPSGAQWSYYCDKVKVLAMSRQFSALLADCKDISAENIETRIGAFIQGAAEIADHAGGETIKSARDFILPVITGIENAVKNRGKFSGLDTGLQNINDIVDGLQSEYIIIAARASIGKTALGMNMAKYLASQKIPVGYFSLEMSSKALLTRVLSDMATVEAKALRNGFMNEKNIQRVCNMGYDLAEYPLYPIDNTRGRFESIIAKSRYMVRCMGVKVIFIDHASLMKYPDRKLQRYEQFSEMSNALQNLQRELNVPLVLLAQLGREAEGKKPTLADLRESGTFEQDADQIWLMHRDRAKNADETMIETEVNIAKNRNGPCGSATLMFFPQFVRFKDKAYVSENR